MHKHIYTHVHTCTADQANFKKPCDSNCVYIYIYIYTNNDNNNSNTANINYRNMYIICICVCHEYMYMCNMCIVPGNVNSNICNRLLYVYSNICI